MIIPQLTPDWVYQQDRQVLAFKDAFYTQSSPQNLINWTEAYNDWRFYAADQSVWMEIYGNMPSGRKRMFNFNHIKTRVDTASGYERRNRKSVICIPRENGHQETADDFSNLMLWAWNKEKILEIESEAFFCALVSGMSLMRIWLDYRKDPVSGDFKVDCLPYNSFIIDPFFKKYDLSDCNGIITRQYITPSEAVTFFPDKFDEILAIPPLGTYRDGRFQFLPETYNVSYNNLMAYDEFYYRAYRTQKLLVDTQNGETFEWRNDDEVRLRMFLENYPEITVVNQEIPTVKVCITLQDRIMYDDVQPTGLDEYPFCPVFTYYLENMPDMSYRVQGLVRQLRDAQFLYNRRKNIELDILESKINSGGVYVEDAVVNPKDLFQSGQGRWIPIKKGHQPQEVVPWPATGLDPSILETSKLLAEEIQQISGVTDELRGVSDADISGYHYMLKQNAAITTLQIPFDHLDRAKILLGRKFLKITQMNMTPGKVERILGKRPSPEFYNKAFGEYDCEIVEGLNTPTQRQMEHMQLLEYFKMGLVSAEAVMDTATIQNKTKVMEDAAKMQQAQQQQMQQKAELELAIAQAQIENLKAQATANQGLGVERLSRVQENQALAVERRAQADKDEEQALLNKVKMLKELEDLDYAHLERLLNLAASLGAVKTTHNEAPQLEGNQTLAENKPQLQ